jgi:hypothetical protein
MLKFILSLVACLLVATGTLLAEAIQPLLVTGPACGAGSARTYSYVIFEDRDGDGNYDWIISAACSGTISGAPWNGSTQQDLFGGGGDPFGQIPVGDGQVTPPTIWVSPTSGPGGFYTWTVTENWASNNSFASSFGRLANGDLTCSTRIQKSNGQSDGQKHLE